LKTHQQQGTVNVERTYRKKKVSSKIILEGGEYLKKNPLPRQKKGHSKVAMGGKRLHSPRDGTTTTKETITIGKKGGKGKHNFILSEGGGLWH